MRNFFKSILPEHWWDFPHLAFVVLITGLCSFFLGSAYLPLRLYYVGTRTESVVVDWELRKPPNLPAHAFSPATAHALVTGVEGWQWVASRFDRGDKCVVLSLPGRQVIMVLKNRPESVWQVFWAWNARFNIWALLGLLLHIVVLGMLIRGLYSILTEAQTSFREVWKTPESPTQSWDWATALMRSEHMTRIALVLFLNVAALAFLWVMLKSVVLVETLPFAETATGAVFLVVAFLMASQLPRQASRWFLRLDASTTLNRIRTIVTNLAGAVAFLVLAWQIFRFALRTNFHDFDSLGGILVEFSKEFFGA